MTLTFRQEQQVQHCISIIQKQYRCSILQINEAAIRQAVARGQSTGEILAWLSRPVRES